MKAILVTLVSGAILTAVGAFVDVQILKAEVTNQSEISKTMHEDIKEIRNDVKSLLRRSTK